MTLDERIEAAKARIAEGKLTAHAVWEPLILDLAAERERLREALAFYADDGNWRMNGPLDPNGPNFTGGPALASEPRA